MYSMKLKEYLYNLRADQAIYIADSRYDISICPTRELEKMITLFADKTFIPKDVLNLEVVKFCGDTYYPGDLCSDGDDWMFDPYEDWYGCTKFYVEGFQELKKNLKLKGVVK